MAAAIHWLVANVEQRPGLEEVAGAVGLTSAHFQRLFRHDVGISPKRFLQYLLGQEAAQLLAGGASALDTAYAVNLSGPGRLHDLTVTLHAMTPGELRGGGAGLVLTWGIHETPFGPVGLAMTARGVCRLEFLSAGGGAAAFRTCLLAAWPGATPNRDERRTREPLAQMMDAHGSGPLSLHVHGSNFQLQVWQALLDVPPGGSTSYGALAAQVGRPRAARAVGAAVGANPVAMVIPCHRVIRSSGALGGYR